MKPWVYLAILLLIIPVQASLLDVVSIAGIKPDLALVLIYIIGLVAGPGEAVVAGIAVGLAQDIGSAGVVGLNGFTRGLVGLGAGFLGRRVLDIASPMNAIFLAAFSLMEGLLVALFIQTFYGAVPFFSLLGMRLIPQALYTGLLGTFLLRFMGRKDIMTVLLRRSLVKE